MKNRAYLLIATTLLATPALAKKNETPKQPCEKKLVGFDLVKFDQKTRTYAGLNENGLKLLKKARDALRERKTMFEKDFQSMGSIYKAVTEARIGQYNAILSGPPGAAKSLVINVFLKGETVPTFKIQVHGMTPETPMIGGQTFESAQKGTYEHNIEGSLADHVVGLIDEGEKGPAGTLAALLSVLNERKVFAGGVEYDAKTRTVYATTNSSLAELMDHFVQGGQPKVGKAWANRFLYKVWIQNWLPKDQQAILDKRNDKREELKAYAANDPSFLNDEIFQKFPPVQWEEIKSVARSLFKFDDNAYAAYRDIAEELRDLTNAAIKQSESNHAQNPADEPFVYTPAADWSERLRQQIPEAALYSAFHDFLLSPLADDENLEASTAKKIMLDSASLWRLYSSSAMISSGSVYPFLNSNGEFDVKFDRILDPSKARDRGEEKEIENMIAEQDRFRTTLLKHLKDLQKQINIVMKVKGGRGGYDPGVSFELQLIKAFEGAKYP